jgi:zinc protease
MTHPVVHRATRFAAAGALALACGAAAVHGQAKVASTATSITIPSEHYVLANGLTVILAPDHATPTVAVDVWYHVGSKNEVPGRTGFAHLFEHVMFTGSGHVPYGVHDKYTEGIGGSNNGTTSNDRTTYYETVPSNYLEHQLWLESDRMGFLLDTLDIAKLNAQRDVVKNERRQRVDNQPYGRADEIITHAMYPSSNPYSWDVIGSMDDLSAASEDDVKNFFRLYYAPNNAFLTIAGDFDPARARAWVTKYFADIPRGKPIDRPVVPATTLDKEVRLVYEDAVQIPRLYLSWPTVGEQSGDRFALSVLASILSRGRTSRLQKPLVYDQQKATTVSASQSTLEDTGDFTIVVVPRTGTSLTALETDVNAVLDGVKAGGPTAEEIQKATAGDELNFLVSLQSNLNKAFRLADCAGFHGDPNCFQAEFQRSRSVTPDDVKRVAAKYLTPGRVILSIVPTGKSDLAAKPEASKKVDGGGR